MPNRSTQTRQITFEQLADLLQAEFEKGNIGSDVYEFIAKNGTLPIGYLRQELRWIIERDGEDLKLTTEIDDLNLKIDPNKDQASKRLGYRPLDNREEFRQAA